MIRFALAAVLAGQWLGGPEKNTREGAEHLAHGRLAEALRAFSRAEGEFPEAPQNDLNLAGVHYRMGENGEGEEPFAQAERGYRAALAGKPEGTLRRDAFFNLGNTLFRSGAFAEAAGAYGEAIALDPDDREARQNLERALRRAEEGERNGDPREQESPDGEPRDGEPEDGEPPDREPSDREPSDREPSESESPEGEPSEPEPSEGAPSEPEPADGEPREEEPPDREPEPGDPDASGSGAGEPPPEGASGTGEAPEISPEQADRILAALAEVEAAFHEAQLERRRARALRRGRH